ncbi:hypothetical protein LSTR_LSTR004918 [Laodelphax striatellus]|uniref:Enkurin domain-containing protein n=1 Tax=Laodelphax striatellus TaxID=195883 RepID=A0A482XP91_LAOST|nr:hypothetical protein LSTR_LSTR004918 [Laodelphax striatellus]
MQRKRLSRSSRKLGRKNYIKANMKKIRDIQSKAKQQEDEEIQRNLSHTQQLKSIKSTIKKSSKKVISQGNDGRITNSLSTRSQVTLPNDNAVSLCMKKFIENIKVSKNNMCDSVSKKKSLGNSIESESSSSLHSSSSEENAHQNFGKVTTRNIVPHKLQASTKNNSSNKTKKPPKNLPSKEFEIVKTIFRQPNYSKAYKNEGCQTIEESNESISSTVLFRYPSNGKSVNTNDTTEQGSQTDIKPKTDVHSKSKIPFNTQKNDRRTEAMRKYQVNKSLRFQKNSVMNKQMTSVTANAMQIERQKSINMRNIRGNSNQNTITASNIEDFEKMCEEIEKTNKMSPFARHQTEFLQNDSGKIKDKIYKSMKKDSNRPKGSITLPEHKRNEYLAQIMIRRRNMMKDLNSASDDRTKTQEDKINLQENLKTIDHAFEVFSQNNLYIDLGKR